mgnify:CR=1 FL=1
MLRPGNDLEELVLPRCNEVLQSHEIILGQLRLSVRIGENILRDNCNHDLNAVGQQAEIDR